MIRHAKWHELPRLVEMGSEMHAAGGFADLPYDSLYTLGYGQRLFDDPDGLILVFEKDGEIRGFLTARVMPFIFCNDRISMNDIWYVDPAYRGTMGAFNLLRRYYDWAKARGAVRVGVSISDESEQDYKTVDRLVRRFGWVPNGLLYKRG